MKTSTTKITLLSAAFLLVFSASAMALPIAGQSVTIKTDYGLGHDNGGGEFGLDIDSNGSIDYTSFCLERNEYITNNGKYQISSVEDFVYNGGKGGGTPDALSDATQWVYYTYIYGNAFGLTKNAALANKVQNVIWWLEDELMANETNLITQAATFYNDYVKNNVSNAYNNYVTAINIKAGNTFAQSQIIAEPVPEPATMLLFGTGIAGLSSMIRRRRMHG